MQGIWGTDKKRVEKRERSVKKREKMAIGWFFSFVHSCQLSFRLGISHHIPGFIQGKYLVHAFSHEKQERRRGRRKARREKKKTRNFFMWEGVRGVAEEERRTDR